MQQLEDAYLAVSGSLLRKIFYERHVQCAEPKDASDVDLPPGFHMKILDNGKRKAQDEHIEADTHAGDGESESAIIDDQRWPQGIPCARYGIRSEKLRLIR